MIARLGTDNYFEDFTVGDRVRHARGKTVTDFDTMTLAQLMMNTADGHYNTDRIAGTDFGRPPTFGGVVASIVYGIASQDTAEHAVAELGVESIRFQHPTFSGDTLYATSEVLEAEGHEDGTGTVRFRHLGINAEGHTVCEMVRRVRLRRRPTGVAAP